MVKQKKELLQSSLLMQAANNYNDYTFQLIRPYIKGRVLEVGCGVGSVTQRLEPHVDELVSIDINREAINYCRKKFNRKNSIKFLNANITNYQDNQKFNTIVCLNVLEHIKDDEKALANMFNLLKVGGILVLLVPFGNFMHSVADKESGHYRRYARKDLKIKLDKHFNVKKLFYFNFIGGLGYFIVSKVLRKKNTNIELEISFFDKYCVRLTKLIDKFKIPFGLSLIAVVKK